MGGVDRYVVIMLLTNNMVLFLGVGERAAGMTRQ
jgi:hypothetical protein